MRQNNKKESGNAFILILVGVFLLGALMFTFSRGSEKGTGNLTKQQSKLAAQEILSYAQSIEGAVDRVRRKGCSESQISFENDIVAGYVNASAPTDKHCHIFEPEGGKASYANADKNWFTSGGSVWNFNAALQVNNIGKTCASASCADLAIQITEIKPEICTAINSLLNLNATTIPSDSDYNMAQFQGTFSAPTDIADEASSNILEGRSSGCVYSDADNQNIFYHVLLAR